MQWPHSTHPHSGVSTAPTDYYSEVVIVHTCAFQSTLLGCQVTLMSANHSRYINNGWTFSGQTSYIFENNKGYMVFVYMYVCVYVCVCIGITF